MFGIEQIFTNKNRINNQFHNICDYIHKCNNKTENNRKNKFETAIKNDKETKKGCARTCKYNIFYRQRNFILFAILEK